MTTSKKAAAQVQKIAPTKTPKAKKAKKVLSPDEKRFRRGMLIIMGSLVVLGWILSIFSYKGII